MEQSTKSRRVGERPQLSVELKLALRQSRSQKGEQLASEQAAEDLDGEEELPSAGIQRDPSRAKPAGRNQAMKMGVLLQVLSPGVKHGQKTDAGSQMSRIGRDLQQGLGHGTKQESIETAWILPGQRCEFLGHGKHHVTVRDGEQFLGLLASQRSRAVDWHLGQLRLRHEL